MDETAEMYKMNDSTAASNSLQALLIKI